jgi:TolB-like protein
VTAGLHVSALLAPERFWEAHSDGLLEGISSGHEQTIVVRGVPFNSKNFHLQGKRVVSELAEPYFVAGEMRPAGTGVRIDLPTGNVSVSGQ